jgi:hypothetical protein
MTRSSSARRSIRKNSSSRKQASGAFRSVCEGLERRQLLSASVTAALSSVPLTPGFGIMPADTSPNGITPQQMRRAYGADQISFGGAAGDGTGQTIAIVIFGSHPTALSDLQNFDAYYGLQNPPSFHRYDENGGTSYPAATSGFEGQEEALDIEWSHVMAPNASIDVIECTNSTVDLFDHGVVTAANLPGVSVISMSFGTGDTGGLTGFDHDFTTPAGHTGVTFLSSSGDSGSDSGVVNYPSDSPNVVAVGGTNVYFTDGAGDYSMETGWSGSGGGISNYESQPGYQSGQVNGVSSTKRTVPDVSMNAGFGVSVYDTTDNPASSPWGNGIGGTSQACPMFAGLVAVADQGRVRAGLTALDGPTQTLPRIYAATSSDYHDITSGNNGQYSAGTGYDLVTGRGSPIANRLINDLAFSTGDLTVTNTNDSGTGSLRQAIINANTYSDGVSFTISFDIPTTSPNYSSGVFTIKPGTQLPTITANHLIINGNTQEIYTGATNSTRPVIYLNGAGQSYSGLVVSGSYDSILNLGIDNFDYQSLIGQTGGILFNGTGATFDTVQGCWIGVAPNGTSAAGNTVGINFYNAIDDSASDGGTGNADVIGDNGVGVTMFGSSYCSIYGADIGITTAAAAVPNTTGVQIQSGFTPYYGNSTNNYVQVSNIDFNSGNGVLITGAGTTGNVVDSDLIGVNYNSTVGLGGYYGGANGGDGVLITNGASGNTIANYGGTPVAGPTVIAGNTGNGVEIDNSSGNQIIGAIIGEASHSIFTLHGVTTTYYPNGGAGVYIHDGATGNFVGSSVSSSSPSAPTANEIAGNTGPGITVADGSSTGNLISGDYIGTDASGDSFGNGAEGVIIFASSETVTGCVISNNAHSGLSLPGNSNLVENDMIGTNAAGTAAAGNVQVGIYINGYSNTAVDDTISGNGGPGVEIIGSTGNQILNSYIGTNAGGTSAVANQGVGVLVTGSSNTISADVISGNVTSGVALEGPGNVVQGNEIGTNLAGTLAIPNGREGVYVDSNSNLIGGQYAVFRNVISGNTGGNASYGVSLDTSAAYNNTIEGNYIGLAANGSSAIPNADGVNVQAGAYNNSIGVAGAGNVISGNQIDGILIESSAGAGMTVQGNYVGINAAGNAAIGNAYDGVEIGTSNNTIGGATTSARNVISGNSNRDGVVVEGAGVSGDLIRGNYIGTNAAGTAAIPNSSGVEIISGATLDSTFGNLISGNSNRGIGLFGSGNTSSAAQGDLIGTDYTGLKPIPNGGIGIYDSGDESLIGGSAAGQGETVDFNLGGGIVISSETNCSITYSTIYDNQNGGLNNSGTLQLINSTITGNSNSSGAGIYNTGTLTVYDSTIDANTASSTGGGIDSAGGSTFLENVIVAQNNGGDIIGAVSSSSTYNLIGNGTGLTGISNGVNHNQVGTAASPINALLGPLAYNGGLTETQAPKLGSPAYNAGTGISYINTDQRNVARPTSGPVDVGAVERQFNNISISGTAIYLRLATDGQTLDIYYNNTGTGTPATYLLSDLSVLSATGTTLNDQLTVDYSNGIPVPGGTGFSYDGLGGTNTVKVIGTAGNDTIGVNPTTISVGSSMVAYAHGQTLIVDPLTGIDSVAVSTGLTASFPAENAGGGILIRNLSALTISGTATLAVGSAAANSDRTLLVVQNPAIFGTLDLGANDADFTNSTPATINSLVKSAYNYAGGANWSGTGITSSTAAADSTHLTALGVVQNNQSGSPLFSVGKTFDGTIPGAADVLVKYTYVGDANLDGKVDGSDYSKIDAGYAGHGSLTGWANGDFNYDGVIDGSDYTLLDNAFNNQRTALPSAQTAAAPAVATPRPATAVAVKSQAAPRSHSAAFVPPPPAATQAASAAFSTTATAADLLEQLKRARSE